MRGCIQRIFEKAETRLRVDNSYCRTNENKGTDAAKKSNEHGVRLRMRGLRRVRDDDCGEFEI